MLTTDELIKKIARNDEVSLTLYNDYDEVVTANELVTLIHNKNNARIRWSFGRAINNVSPFTSAIIHKGKNVWAAFAIRPAYLEGRTDAEITYAY